jgi:hypothetical protein
MNLLCCKRWYRVRGRASPEAQQLRAAKAVQAVIDSAGGPREAREQLSKQRCLVRGVGSCIEEEDDDDAKGAKCESRRESGSGWEKVERGRKLSGWGFIHVGNGSAQTRSAFEPHLEASAVDASDGPEADAAVCGRL